MPAVSPTVWLPVLRVSSPVEPPSPTLVRRRSVVPSIWRLNRPRVGGRAQVLRDLELAGLAGVRDHADDVGVRRDGTVSGPPSSPWSGRRRAGAVVVLADDRLLVVGQVGAGAGGLTDGVVAGVEGLLAGRAAVTDVRGVAVGRAVDLEVEQAAGPCSGSRSFLTSSLPVSRVLVITQTMSESVVTGTVSGPRVVAGGLATIEPVPLSSLQTIDFW